MLEMTGHGRWTGSKYSSARWPRTSNRAKCAGSDTRKQQILTSRQESTLLCLVFPLYQAHELILRNEENMDLILSECLGVYDIQAQSRCSGRTALSSEADTVTVLHLHGAPPHAFSHASERPTHATPFLPFQIMVVLQ